MCKSVLLYADHVTIASPRLFAVVASLGIVAVTPQTFAKVMARAVRDGGETMRGAADMVREFSDALEAMPPRHALTPEQRKSKAGLVRQIDRAMDSLRATSAENLTSAGADPLIRAVQEGLVTLEPLTRQDEEFDELPEDLLLSRYIEVVDAALGDPSSYPLFDDTTGHLAHLGLEAGFFTRSDMVRERGTTAATGAGLTGRLPNFPLADMSEIIDIRKTLRIPLERFRQAVRKLAVDIQLPAEDPNFGAVLDDRWLHEVQPAIDEIEERIRQDVSLRALTGQFIAGAFDPMRNALPAAGVATLAMSAGSGKMLAAAAAVAAAGVTPAVKALQQRQKASRDIARGQYYFLYKANRRMAS